MSWTERQQRMLQEMGLSLWQPKPQSPVSVPESSSSSSIAAVAQALPAARPGPPRPAADPAPAPRPAARRTDPAALQTPVPTAQPPQDDDRARDIATLDWSALRSAVSACQACELCGSRTQTVFGVGHLQAQWMVVGEAPGEQEDAQGEPFVGPSGALLDNMLRALKLTRSHDASLPASQRVYIANTLKCRPPRNRNPAPAELQACEPFLIRQIALLKPRIILAMGRFAVQALLRSSDPVGQLRGQVHTYQGVPLVVTYHPAYLLRNPVHKARAWDDLCLAAQVAESAGASST